MLSQRVTNGFLFFFFYICAWLAVVVFKGGRPLEHGQDQDRLRKQIMSFRHSVRGQV